MAKAILEYDLTDSDDRLDHQKAVKANDAFIALWDISQQFRSELKHGNLDTNTFNKIEKMSSVFYDTLQRYGINIDMVE